MPKQEKMPKAFEDMTPGEKVTWYDEQIVRVDLEIEKAKKAANFELVDALEEDLRQSKENREKEAERFDDTQRE